jgi:hypothetical protein
MLLLLLLVLLVMLDKVVVEASVDGCRVGSSRSD